MRLWKHKNGTYYITFKRGVHSSLKTKDKAKAEKAFRELDREQQQGRLVRLEQGELKLFSDFKDEFLDIRKDKAPSTQRAERLALDKFLEFYGNRAMGGITPQKLEQFRSDLLMRGKEVKNKQGRVIGKTKLLETSCNTHIRHLKIALKKAIKWGYIKKGTLDLRDDLKQYHVDKRQPVCMTKEDVIKLLSISDEDPVMRIPIAVQVYTGMSRAEVIAPMHIEDEHITYKRVKTKKLIRVNIADGLKPYLVHLKKGIQNIFPWKNPRTYSRYFEKIVKKAELIGISPHKVRHTFATLLLQDGEDLKTISELMGHSSITITAEFYAHISDEQKKKAVNRLKF